MKIRDVMLVLIACVACFVCGRYTKRCDVEYVTDVLTNIDTVRDTIPLPVYETVVKVVPELFPIYVTLGGDTVREPVLVPVDITQREYKTGEYRLLISGYKPNLDYIETYNRTEIIKEKSRPRRFGLGMIGGYGIGKHGLSPYIGIGGYYSLW